MPEETNIVYVTVVSVTLLTFKFQQIVRSWYSVQVTFVCTALWKIYFRSNLPNLFEICRDLQKLWRNTFWCVFYASQCICIYYWFDRNRWLSSSGWFRLGWVFRRLVCAWWTGCERFRFVGCCRTTCSWDGLQIRRLYCRIILCLYTSGNSFFVVMEAYVIWIFGFTRLRASVNVRL